MSSRSFGPLEHAPAVLGDRCPPGPAVLPERRSPCGARSVGARRRRLELDEPGVPQRPGARSIHVGDPGAATRGGRDRAELLQLLVGELEVERRRRSDSPDGLRSGPIVLGPGRKRARSCSTGRLEHGHRDGVPAGGLTLRSDRVGRTAILRPPTSVLAIDGARRFLGCEGSLARSLTATWSPCVLRLPRGPVVRRLGPERTEHPRSPRERNIQRFRKP